jgi:nicotinate-nucleotide pyrophosphorylase (carboxylating)
VTPSPPPIEPPAATIDALIDSCLEEDLGLTGDLTTASIFADDHQSSGRIVARAAGVIAGLGIGARVFERLEGSIRIVPAVSDGDRVAAGTSLATLEGSSRALLTGERTCLNILGHLSGVATATRTVVDEIDETPTRVVDTRKTTPGLRAFEKYAVRCGGGHNHRFGLHDAVMIKDNHIAAAGSISAALAAVRAHVGHTVSITVEVDHIDQIDDAVDGGAHIILLDNMRGDDLRAGVARVAGRAITEASGGITPDGAAAVAAAGVDVISLGWLTHSAPRLDVALDL